MASLLTSLYLLNLKEGEIPHGTDVDCVRVSKKNTCSQYQYEKEKSDFFISRTKESKKNSKLKKDIKSVEKLFRSYKSIFLSWELNQPLKIFFSNGSIVNITLSSDNDTLEKIEIYNNLIGKFIQSRIVDAIVVDDCIYVTYCEPKLTLINISQDASFFPTKLFGIKQGKLTGSDPKISHIDLIGPSNKSIERKLSLNSSKDNLLVWWKLNGDDVWPWTPVTYLADRINMIVYSLNESFNVLCTVKTHGELIQANFSKHYSNQIFTLERIKSETHDDINVCVYEIIDNHCHHAFLSKLPLTGNLLSCDWSSNEKLLISDSANLLLMYDLKKRTSLVTNLLFLPKQISWHPQNCIALVIGVDNQLQCFDTALTCVKIQLFYSSHSEQNIINLNSYFSNLLTVQKVLWQKSDFRNSCIFLLDSDMSSILILNFCSGCITQNKLGIMELSSQYLKSNSIDEAILLLRSLNWCHESEVSFQCLSKIVNFLFRRPFNTKNQAGLELALGAYYDNVDSYPKLVVRNYQHKVRHLARRFFHYLLRHHELRKAFLLAIDLESQDLFLDLYNIAKRKGENILAMVALQKADECNLSSDSCSTTPSSSDFESVSSSGSFDESDKELDCYTNLFINSNYLSNQAHCSSDITRQCVGTKNCSIPTKSFEETSENCRGGNLVPPLVPSSFCTNREKIVQINHCSSLNNSNAAESVPQFQIHSSKCAQKPTNSSNYSRDSSFRSNCAQKPTYSSNYSRESTFLSNCAQESTYSSNHSQKSTFHSNCAQESTLSRANSDIVSEQRDSSFAGIRSNSFMCDKSELDTYKNIKFHSSLTTRLLPEYPPSYATNSNEMCLSSETSILPQKNDGNTMLHSNESSKNILISLENKTDEEETEELEESRIKLVHLGII